MGRFIASDQVRSDAEIKAVIEGDATLDLDAASTIDGVQIASTDDVRTDAEIVAAVEASATLDLDAGATIDGSGIVSDSDLALVALDDLADVSASSPSDQDVLTWDDGTSTWIAQAGGGLTGLTNVSTADYAGFTVDGTNDDLVLAPNGTGAIRARTDGNARGDYAVCLVPTAFTTSQVAAGTNSVAIGRAASTTKPDCVALGYAAAATLAANAIATALGAYATATNEHALAIMQSDATGSRSIAIGDNAEATAIYAIAVGGFVQASAARAIAIGVASSATAADAVAIGDDADATAANAVAVGAEAKANRISSIVLSATGADSKPLTRDSTRINGLHHVVNLKASSTDATPVEATSDGAAASTTDDQDRNVVVLANDKVASFRLHMTAIQENTNDAAVYIVTGGVKCIAGTATILGTNTTTTYEDDAGWDCTVTASGNQLVVTCTGDDGGAVSPTVYTTTWRGTLTLTYED